MAEQLLCSDGFTSQPLSPSQHKILSWNVSRFKTLHFQFSVLEIWFWWVLQVWAAVGHCRLLWVVLGHSGGGRHGRIEAASAGCTFSALLQKYSPPILFVSPKYSTTQISKDKYSIHKYFFISQYMFCFCSQSYIYISTSIFLQNILPLSICLRKYWSILIHTCSRKYFLTSLFVFARYSRSALGKSWNHK